METDVIIIGAGIAGISAAKALYKNGISFILVEASHRIGGRAYSEELGKGNWFDLGCSYLHNGDINPFTEAAKKLNIPLGFEAGNLFHPERIKYFFGGKKLSVKQSEKIRASEKEILKKMEEINLDCPIIDCLNLEDPNLPIFWHLFSSLNAADPDMVSAKDYLSSVYSGPDYPVPYGFGNLISKWGSDIAAKLNTSVTRIDWQPGKLKVTTSKGSISAQKVLFTVSTAVLQNDIIKIVPDLPLEKRTALKNLPMGILNKVGVSFSKRVFSENDRGYYVSWPKEENIDETDISSFEISTCGFNNIVVFLGGRFGSWLEERGPETMRAYAIEKIGEVLGQKATNYVDRTVTTAWSNDFLTGGSYSYAKPFGKRYRKELAKSINRTLYFAGEATVESHYGSAHGAHLSGVLASKEIIKDIKTNKL